MKLPSIPYPNSKSRVQTLDFKGINLSAAAGEGEFSDCYGITTKNYPWLTQRDPRAPIDGYDSPVDVYEWDGHLIVVDGGMLYYDGEPLCSVVNGKKQYAVVNTKMVVWPDGIIIDLTNNTAKLIEASFKNGFGAQIGTDYIEFNPYSVGHSVQYPAEYTNPTWTEDGEEPYIWVYDSATWDSVNEEWALTNPQQANLFTGDADGKYYIPGVSVLLDGSYNVEIPVVTWSATAPTGSVPAPANTLGIVSVLSKTGPTTTTGTSRSAPWLVRTDWETTSPPLTDVFQVGDAVSIEGTLYGIHDAEHVLITAVTDDRITLDTELISPAWYMTIPEDMVVDGQDNPPSVSWSPGGYWYTVSLAGSEPYTLHENNILLYRATAQEVVEWNPVTESAVQTISVAAPAQEHTGDYDATTYLAEETSFTVSVDFPQLDFICSHENRLWGVSNSVENRVWNESTNEWDTFTSRVIYASALGEPTHMWEFQGLDTDSYQVAVGSENDFTAICSFGGGVCCFKEDRVVKVLGSYPSEYYTTEYRIAGVQNGSDRSLAVINEVLYYKGIAGVYAWNGGIPSMISEQLGNWEYTDAVGGTDGVRYYISMRDTEDRLFVYDRGLWVKDDNVRADSMVSISGQMYYLIDGEILTDGEEEIEWMAETAPITETTLNRKGYTRILIRLDMYEGSNIEVETKQDRGEFITVWSQSAAEDVTLNIPLRIGRCDRFQIRLSGKGRVTVQSMARDVKGGTER